MKRSWTMYQKGTLNWTGLIIKRVTSVYATKRRFVEQKPRQAYVVKWKTRKRSTLTQNNYIQKGISRRIVSHASLRMLNFLASVMREFYEEIDGKNRIFGRKTDILRKCVARCAILLNIYGKKDCFDVSTYNWAHKHHFIVRKTKKTYLSDCENSHEKQQTGIFCELKTCFYLPMSG